MAGADYLKVSPDVQQALAGGQGVVALESTIISHGMPYPRNVEVALEIESTVRKHGAVPATIAIIDGVLRVGLTEAEIRMLGDPDTPVIKTSRRDMPSLVAQGQTGATTVAATMVIADLAGIRVFATGGIGGVHRGVEETLDISADLEELTNTDVAVVCAGAKSILDIPRTLEYLETKGVPVVGYGTSAFPAFYARESGCEVESRVEFPDEAAGLLQAKWDLGLSGGVLFANPIPREHALDAGELEAIIEAALAEMTERGITGKETTPFLLARVSELTGGRSLDANVALVLNNARVAAGIAVAYAALGKA